MKYTQEELESKSNFELSELIAIKEGFSVSKEQWMHLGDRDENLVIIDTSKESSDIINRTFDTVDYCNNWADMGPLIDKSKISIEYRAHNSLFPQAKMFNTDQCYVSDKNVLRAAAIVYLLMQGS